MRLSVVVIGRNESAGLLRLHQSILPFKAVAECEFIYVDSASTDGSVAVARDCFDKVVVLAADKNLCASAGRYVGVERACGDWILFLDGDMTVDPAAVRAITAFMEAAHAEAAGTVGAYQHHFPDGSSETWTPRFNGGRVDHFGGAVLLRADALRVENWNPRIFSNEEADLHSRLRGAGFKVGLMDGVFIHHYTEKFDMLTKVKGNFFPKNGYLGKKFFGFGQLVAARVIDGNLGSLVKLIPEPFVFVALLVIALLLLLAGLPKAALGAAVMAALFVLVRKSAKSIVMYLAMISQLLHGMSKYDRRWLPTIATEFNRGAAPDVSGESRGFNGKG